MDERYRIVYGGECRPCAGMARRGQPTKRATLIFLRDQLLYDIANCAYVEGDIMADDAQDAKHQLQDIAEGGNADRVTRILELTHARCVEMLYPYSKEPTEDGVIMLDVLDRKGSYVIVLSLPSDYSQTTVEYLARLIHELMVCRGLADWLSVTNPAAAARWGEKGDAAAAEIRSALNTRMGHVRRRPSPW